MDDDDDVALTRKAINELMSGSTGSGIQHERKLNPLGRPNPNKRFLDRTLNSAIKHNKRELARSQVNSREKLRELDEHEKRRAQNSFYRSGDVGNTRHLNLNKSRRKQTSTNSPRSRSSSSSSNNSRKSKTRNRKIDSKRHHRKKISKVKKHKHEKYKRRDRSCSRSRSLAKQSYKQTPQENIEHKGSTVPQYTNNNFAKMESYYMHSNSATFASIASMALAFGHIQEAMQVKASSVTENLQDDKEDDKLSDLTLNSSLLGELSLSESTSEDENKNENEILTIDVSSSDDLESLAERRKSNKIHITKRSSSCSDSCISVGSDDDIDELANTVQNKPKESVVVELSSASESSRAELKVIAHTKLESEEETVDLTED